MGEIGDNKGCKKKHHGRKVVQILAKCLFLLRSKRQVKTKIDKVKQCLKFLLLIFVVCAALSLFVKVCIIYLFLLNYMGTDGSNN
jgi:hypothetical protein